MVKGALGDMDLFPAGISDCKRQTMDIHCPLFRESPINISRLPLSFSHISAPFHLQKLRKKTRSSKISKRFAMLSNPELILGLKKVSCYHECIFASHATKNSTTTIVVPSILLEAGPKFLDKKTE